MRLVPGSNFLTTSTTVLAVVVSISKAISLKHAYIGLSIFEIRFNHERQQNFFLGEGKTF